MFTALIGFITDFLWFKELGYVSVFLKQLLTQLKIGIPTFIIVTLLSYIYFKYLKINYYKKIESKTPDKSRRVNLISWGMAAIFGGVITYFAVTNMWFDSLKFIHSTDFELDDPLFGFDTSFYVMKLDFIKELNSLFLVVLVVLIIMTLVYYAVLMGNRRPTIFQSSDTYSDSNYDSQNNFYDSQNNYFMNGGNIFDDIKNVFSKKAGGGQGWQAPKPDKNNLRQILTFASKQVIVVGIAFFLMLGIHFFLRQFDLLHAHTGVVYGAGYTDTHITLWVYRILMVLSVLGMIAVIIAVKKHRIRYIAAVPVIMIVISLLGSG